MRGVPDAHRSGLPALSLDLRASPGRARAFSFGEARAPALQRCLVHAVHGPERFWGELLLRRPPLAARDSPARGRRHAQGTRPGPACTPTRVGCTQLMEVGGRVIGCGGWGAARGAGPAHSRSWWWGVWGRSRYATSWSAGLERRSAVGNGCRPQARLRTSPISSAGRGDRLCAPGATRRLVPAHSRSGRGGSGRTGAGSAPRPGPAQPTPPGRSPRGGSGRTSADRAPRPGRPACRGGRPWGNGPPLHARPRTQPINSAVAVVGCAHQVPPAGSCPHTADQVVVARAVRARAPHHGPVRRSRRRRVDHLVVAPAVRAPSAHHDLVGRRGAEISGGQRVLSAGSPPHIGDQLGRARESAVRTEHRAQARRRTQPISRPAANISCGRRAPPGRLAPAHA